MVRRTRQTACEFLDSGGDVSLLYPTLLKLLHSGQDLWTQREQGGKKR